MRYIKYIILIWSILQNSLAQAQQYPVEVQTFVTPPYPQQLRSYWDTFENKIQTHLLLKDLNSPVRNVTLRFSLENLQGQVITQSAPYATVFQTQLTAGVRKTLSNLDFKAVFALENLSGISENFYNDLLPEGTYFFCFTAYDATTQTPISNKSRAMVSIRRYTPPMLQLPTQGEIISKNSHFQHIVFQWTMRDPAPFTQYEFTLKEVWDNSLAPDEAFLSGRLIYQVNVPSNTLLYGNDKPFLLENKRYAWRVRAFTNNPNNPNQTASLFKNNGESETFVFDYIANCEVPKFLIASPQANTANIRWQSGGSPQTINTNGSLYKVLYREKGKAWKSVSASMPNATLSGLKRGKNYIYKVGIACGLDNPLNNNAFNEQTYLYSTEQEFTTTDKISDSLSVQCGVKPQIRIKNREPLQEVLGVNETFTAGDFPITVLSATGSNGVFSGEGYVQVPYLANTKIKVTFDNIKINSERQLFDGKIVTTYDKSEKNVQFVQEGVGEIFGDAGAKQQKINFEIAEIKKDENGRLIVVGKVDEKTGIAPQLTLPAGSDYQITDNSNKVWAIDEKGETIIEEKANTQLANNSIKENQTKSQEQPKTDHFEIQWDFSQSEFAFDASSEIPYKALVKGKEDIFQVTIHQKDSLSYSFHFQTDKGVKIASQELQKGVYKLSRKGLFDFADEELWVVAKNTKTDKEEIISKCILVHLPEKQVNVMLVPLKENLNLQPKITEIQQFYAKVGVNLAISVDTAFPITENISTENQFGDLSTYSPDQQRVISAYTAERSPKSEVYYIFVDEQTSSQQGYMRLGGQFGFVMDNNARTIAHELGHGIFKLEHPFKKDKSQVGKTTSIMDYGSGTDFLFPEWKQIGDPKLKLYAFQGQQEGELAGGYAISPDHKIFSVNTYTITDKVDYKKYPLLANDGVVRGVVINNVSYFWSSGQYVSTKDIYTPKGLEINNLDDNKYVYLFFDKEKKCNEQSYKAISVKKLKEHILLGKSIQSFIKANINDKGKRKLYCVKSKPKNELWGIQDVTDEICDSFNVIELEKYNHNIYDNLQQALSQIKIQKERKLGNFAHIGFCNISTSQVNTLLQDNLEVFEDKFYLLSKYTNVDFIVLFLKIETNSYIKQEELQKVVDDSVIKANTQRNLVYVVVPFSEFENIFEVTDQKCYQLVFGQNNSDVIREGSFKDNGSLSEQILQLFANIEKPVIFNKFYQYADGSLQNYIYKSKKNQRGYPFIKHLEFYQSKALHELSKCLRTANIGKSSEFEEIFDDMKKACYNSWQKSLNDETAPNGLGNSELWEKLSINDLGKFREVYMDYGRNGTPDYPRYLWQNSVDTWQWGSKVTIALETSDLPPNVFYDFEKIKILDDAVYGTLDIFGAIPGLDTFTDPVGAVYAAARSDVENIVIYSASAGIPLAGAVYVRGGAKALSKTDQITALVAKQADNTDGFDLVYKNISEIEPNEFYVASSIDGKQNQEFLEQTKKYLDKNAIKKQVDGLAKAKSLSPTLSKWVDEIKDVSLRRKIENLNADDLAKLEKDFLSKSNGNELKKLITTADDLDKWKLLKEDPHYAFELAQENPNWEKWAKSNFFKEVTKKGDEFEKAMLAAVKTRTGKAYNELKKLVPDLDQRKLISQMQFCLPGKTPPCSAQGEYFVADQVWVKYDAKGNIQDMIIVDTKLSEKTTLSAGQAMAKQQAGKGSLAFKPQIPKEFDEVDNVRLPIDIQQGQQIQVKAFYKMYGDGNNQFIGIK